MHFPPMQFSYYINCMPYNIERIITGHGGW